MNATGNFGGSSLNTMPRVSILVPVYNVAPYLRQALDSILAQTFRDFELILINDGSTDGSGAIIDEYRQRDTRIVAVHKENEGVARTLNLGLSMARGEYIRRFDSDDTCLPNALEKQVNYLDGHPNVALVGTQIAFQSNRGKVARHFRNPRNDYFQGEICRFAEPADFYQGCPIIHATVLLRRSIIEASGGYRAEFLTSEDIDLWLRMVEHHRMVVINECSYFVRLHSTSATQQHAVSRRFYRQLALAFHEERISKGSDPLQRGEPMPRPPVVGEVGSLVGLGAADGREVHPELDFTYRLLLDAGDWVNAFKLARQGLQSGWRCAATYKLLLFPLLGDRVVQRGVRAKALLKRAIPT